MSSEFWVGVFVIVCVLELVRIAISAGVLIHILRSGIFRDARERPGAAAPAREPAVLRARREAALPATMNALRGAMDEVAAERAGSGVQAAIDALDRYASLHAESPR